MKTYTIETRTYNERRYGRPWIAELRGKEFVWGQWTGRNGEAGRLSIDAEPGALLAEGQKDLRKGRGGVNAYYLALPSGDLANHGLGTEVQARDWHAKGWRAYAEWRLAGNHPPSWTPEQVEASNATYRAMLEAEAEAAPAETPKPVVEASESRVGVKRTITETERATMTNALRTAADVYRRDAELTTSNQRLYDQFLRQAEEADALAVSIDNAELIELQEGTDETAG